MDELTRERYGSMPIREAIGAKPVTRAGDDEVTKARRRRILCDALNDVSQTYRRRQAA
jgi:hypothetical protein